MIFFICFINRTNFYKMFRFRFFFFKKQLSLFGSCNLYFNKIVSKFFYKRYVNNNGGAMAYISYIPSPFFKRNDIKYLSGHQNRKESLLIGDILENFGFSYIVERFDLKTNKNDNYQIVFGLEPNFCKLALKNKDSIKIYYATGAYCKHQNSMIKLRTDSFNKKNNYNIKYSRLVEEHNAYDLADYIFQIGTKWTIETYPKELQSKIIIIDQSSEEFNDFDTTEKLKNTKKNKFIWFGSNGSILKGLDIVLEYFSQKPEYELYIVGSVDADFKPYLNKVIKESNNIKFTGYMYVHDPEFYRIIEECAFLVFPSASEGCPGSVINLMKMGVIPIVSKYAAVDEIQNLGFVIDDFTSESLGATIDVVQNMSDDEIMNLSMKNIEYSREKYNLARFKLQFELNLSNILKINNYNNC